MAIRSRQAALLPPSLVAPSCASGPTPLSPPVPLCKAAEVVRVGAGLLRHWLNALQVLYRYIFTLEAQCNTTHDSYAIYPSFNKCLLGLSKSSLLNNFHSSYYYQAGSISISESLQKIYCLTTKVLVSRTLTVTSKCELYEELICSLEFHTILVGSYLFFVKPG